MRHASCYPTGTVGRVACRSCRRRSVIISTTLRVGLKPASQIPGRLAARAPPSTRSKLQGPSKNTSYHVTCAIFETASGSQLQNKAELAAELPATICKTTSLDAVVTFTEAVDALHHAVSNALQAYRGYPAAVLRFEVPLPRGTTALRWLQGQRLADLAPAVYFSGRKSAAPDTPGSTLAEAGLQGWTALAGIGAAWLWQGEGGKGLPHEAIRSMQRFLNPSEPRVRVLGASRFNTTQQPEVEWEEFGAYCFVLPQVEYLEDSGCGVLACTVAWHSAAEGYGAHAGAGCSTPEAAVSSALAALAALRPPATPLAASPLVQHLQHSHTPNQEQWVSTMGTLLEQMQGDPRVKLPAAFPAATTEQARREFMSAGQQGLDDLLAALTVAGDSWKTAARDGGSHTLNKVVLARRSRLLLEGQLEPLALLEALQDRDPRAYQLYMAMPSGACFLGCSPERLYVRSGRSVASEAVAATRPRGTPGDIEADFRLALDLLQNPKDHAEFVVVRNWLESVLGTVCDDVTVEVPKSVLKQSMVQHLYGRLAGTLQEGRHDGHLLEALHPTPAVCGQPREAAFAALAQREPFDRGLYSGPFGWMSGTSAEFAVAIRSALVRSDVASPSEARGPVMAGGRARTAGVHEVFLYAGVGVVPGSDPQQEWQELELKVRQFETLLAPRMALSSMPNINLAWAWMAVEELCRLGVGMFCIAPGSRSTPLAVAAALHPRARINIGIDERSLGFWALGYGRATGRPAAVITTSGTAVANLMPAAVEASLAAVPLLLITADRPVELRDTGANQTIDQVKIFGGYARHFQDLAPPQSDVPARMLLTSLDTAMQHAVGAAARPGPVHLNFQFREPLAPVPKPWDAASFLRGLANWQQSQRPYTQPVVPSSLLQRPIEAVAGGAPGQAGARQAGPAVATLDDQQLVEFVDTVRSARRGLLVVGELTDAGDIATVRHISDVLGWPMAADVLSGLRVGAAGGSGSDGAGSCLVNHIDHILLGDATWWESIQPDVVLQVGPRLTSKRLTQFIEWAALGNEGQQQQQPAVLLYAGSDMCRHDAAHLVSQRFVGPLAALRAILSASLAHGMSHAEQRAAGRHMDADLRLDSANGAPSQAIHTGLRHQNGNRKSATAATYAVGPSLHQAASSSTDSNSNTPNGPETSRRSSYCRLLQSLDAAVAHAISDAISGIGELSEPALARELSTSLPQGNGLFLGNSMPIRDMDMYAVPREGPHAWSGGAEAGPDAETEAIEARLGSHHGASTSGRSASGSPVAANRGASGIDGVLSTAAGFAQGLGRPVTLVVGDVSFLHDVNGLGLLRGGEMRPPLTVVLVNNGGGAIFSFLPVASAVPVEMFTPLWATPPNVDLEGLCRAHGIPHQKVLRTEELQPALTGAWGLNRHSVVEVVTRRESNLALHKQIQAAALKAAQAAYRVLVAPGVLPIDHDAVRLAPELRIASLEVHHYALPLREPLTTGASSMQRIGMLLRVSLSGPHDGEPPHVGLGDVAPLPGLHEESVEDAGAQLTLVCELLRGAELPRTVQLLGGRLNAWLHHALGFPSSRLLPSVQFALETALLGALASEQGTTMAEIIAGGSAGYSSGAAHAAGCGCPEGSACRPPWAVAVNGLVSNRGSLEAVIDEAEELAMMGYKALKVKVGRRANPAEDASILLGIRKAVGPNIVLRADANRAWTLDQALQFGRLACDASLQYIEEPTRDPCDLAAFHLETGIAVALDESVDEGRVLIPGAAGWAQPRGVRGAPLDLGAASGLGALVVKPSVLGSLERLQLLVSWAQQQGIRVVVTSAFESSVGLAVLAHVAAAVDASMTTQSTPPVSPPKPTFSMTAAPLNGSRHSTKASPLANGSSTAASSDRLHSTPSASLGAGLAAPSDLPGSSSAPPNYHGLATACWFLADVPDGRLLSKVQPAAAGDPAPGVHTEHPGRMAIALSDADAVLRGCAPPHNCPSIKTAMDATVRHERREHVSTSAGEYDFHCVTLSCGPAAPAPQHSQVLGSPAGEVPSSSPSDGDDTLGNGSGLGAVAIVDSACDDSSPGTIGRPTMDATPQNSSDHAQPDCCPIPAAEHATCSGRPQIVLLHGFLGSHEDWQPLAAALASSGASCLAVDLPGHGRTTVRPHAFTFGTSDGVVLDDMYSIEATADALAELLRREQAAAGAERGSVVIGYSLGARLALALASRHPPLVSGVVAVSGSPGLADSAQRAARAASDDALASALASTSSLHAFVEDWYRQPLWGSLRQHPHFGCLLQQRAAAGQPQELARGLAGMSTGRMVPLWSSLPLLAMPVLLIAGALDHKFLSINRRMLAALNSRTTHADPPTASSTSAAADMPATSSPDSPHTAGNGGDGDSSDAAVDLLAVADTAEGSSLLLGGQHIIELGAQQDGGSMHKLVEVPGAGHAVHVERPDALLSSVRDFIAACGLTAPYRVV